MLLYINLIYYLNLNYMSSNNIYNIKLFTKKKTRKYDTTIEPNINGGIYFLNLSKLQILDFSIDLY